MKSPTASRARAGARLALLLGAAMAAAPGMTSAQAGGEGFLFRRPVASLSVQAGYAAAQAGSDVFDLARQELFLDRGDLGSPYVGGALTVSLGDRWAIVVEAGHAWSRTNTEWRDFTEEDLSPIRHTVSFSRTPVTAGVRWHLTPQGRGIGRFVWIPSRVTPWIAAGGGFMRYEFVREGDFVDVEALEIYPDRFEHVGTAPTAYGGAGVQISLGRSLFLTGEGRYTWARDDLDGSVYDGFEPIDLSGLRFTAGFGVRF